MSTPSGPVQYRLFEFAMDLSELRQTAEEYMEFSRAPNTLKAYRHSWKVYEQWCGKTELAALPATPDTLKLFFAWMAEKQKYRLQTICLMVAAINHVHKAAGLTSPIDEEVRKVLGGITRKKAREERPSHEAGKTHLSVHTLRKICRVLRDDDPADVRDRAVILLGFASGWRRSQLARLTLADARFDPKGVRLWARYSKTDQQGKGSETCIGYGTKEYTCPVRALERWMAVRGEWRGPLFSRIVCGGRVKRDVLSGQAICEILQRALRRVGEDPEEYGAHSMRSGMITALAEKGRSLRCIMDRSGHKSIETVMRYIKSQRSFRSDPLAGVL